MLFYIADKVNSDRFYSLPFQRKHRCTTENRVALQINGRIAADGCGETNCGKLQFYFLCLPFPMSKFPWDALLASGN